MPLLQNFRVNLIQRIAESGLSKTRVAELAGMHRVTLHKLLKGQFEPSLDTCEKLAHVLGYDEPEEIFKKTTRSRKKTA